MFGLKKMHTAFETWNQKREPLESVEARIHDHVPLDKLHDRAHGYVNTMIAFFPQAMPRRTDVVLEIGPGVGYIMQAIVNRLVPAKIIGLDVAPAMIEHAKARLVRDNVDATNWSFEQYDGITMPFEDHSIDFIYSVACLQHIPKAHVYNLFSEMLRVLKDGYVCIHLLAFSFLPKQTKPFAEEVADQLNGRTHHWLHYYAKDELIHVLAALGAADVNVTEHDGSLWAIFRRPR